MNVIVVGGGAAGFFAAIHHQTAHPRDQVIIIEKSANLLSKVKISGGGRCNVTHACFTPNELCTFYPRGGKALLGPFHRFQPRDTMAWFESRGVPLKIEPDNRVFPVSNNANDIANCLLNEAKTLGIRIWTQCPIQRIQQKKAGHFEVLLTNGVTHACNKLVLATGSNRQGHAFAESLGHAIVPPIPSLFTFKIADKAIHNLAGLSVKHVHIRLGINKKNQSTGPLLITHWGFSGPAIIKASAWQAQALHDCGYCFTMTIHWLANKPLSAIDTTLKKAISNQQHQRMNTQSPFSELPNRLWCTLLNRWDMALPERWGQLTQKHINQLSHYLTNDSYQIEGKSPFKDEFVTCGGVALNEINFKTMESRICPNLHMVGELLNIDGITGGFNFQAAWTTGAISAGTMGLLQNA